MAPISSILQIKKRSGDVVTFDPQKIYYAMKKAFLEVHGGVNEAALSGVTENVVQHLEKNFGERTPGVEDVQNTVENVLMEKGHFDVARVYIIYRYEHSKVREEKKIEVLKKIEEEGLYVKKRDGHRELFNINKLKRFLGYAAKGFEKEVNIDLIAEQCRLELHEDIETKNITKSLIMVVRSYIEQDPAYSKVAARLLLWKLYKDIIGAGRIDFSRLDTQLREVFPECIRKAVAAGRLDAKILTFDLVELAKSLKFERDDLLDFMAMQTLNDRYFTSNPVTKEIFEGPQFFWMRVAMGFALAEKEEERHTRAVQFYEVISTLRYTPSTPTLFHSGTMHPQMSACYLNTVEDSLDHIFKVFGDNAQLSKWSGGIGTDWTNLRGTGALIRGTGVESQGTIPFLKIANDTTVAINRSGKRRGATCVYMEVWHYDIEDFLELRKNTGDDRRRTHDMDTCNWIPDLFMERVKTDGDWTLFSPDETPDLHHIYGREFKERYEFYETKVRAGEIRLFKTLKARDLWKRMITMLFETGHPWMTWKDACNVRSPQDHVGVVHNSNLCTEITLNTSADETAVCNIGSLNISRHIKNGALDQDLLHDTVRSAMRMLDNVVDLNYYPTKEGRVSNMRHRPVGLGLMGTQDALYLLDIPFDSDVAVRFADTSMEAISYYAILSSSELARERGRYQTYKGSKWDRGIFPVDTIALLEQERGAEIPIDKSSSLDWTPVREHVKKYGMRNSNTMAIAPTATISTINGSVPSIEPIYKNIYVKSNQTGDFTIINEALVIDLKKLGLWDYEMLGKIKYNDGNISAIDEIPQKLKDKYKETFDIDPRWSIRQAAVRGKWIDQSQSFNIFYGGKSGKEISDIYMYAWEMGLKTTYYLRTLGASQVEKSTVDTTQFGSTHDRKAFNTSVSDASAAQAAASAINSPTAEVEQSPMVMGPDGVEIKLCKINDPGCESCQ
jgi:ribonucleoside-diphosphate reductase alpha chain